MTDTSSRREEARARQSAHLVLLHAFVETQAEGRADTTAQRYRRVLVRLLLMLDTMDVEPFLGSAPAAALEVERDLGRDGSFLRLLGLEELVCCLPAFLEPPWLPQATGERRTQLSLVERLLREPALCRSVDPCALLTVRQCVREVRAEGPGRPRLRLVQGGQHDHP